MIVVDSHCHVSRVWYEPVESLVFQMDRHEVAQAVLIQMQGEFDNGYQGECGRRYPGRFASVVVLDPERRDAEEELGRLAEEGASGVRFKATTRSPGADPLAIWRAAGRLGLAVSCGGTAEDFGSEAFAALVADLPDVTIVVEHLASINQPVGDEAAGEARLRGFELARFPNVLLKAPGLGEFCPRAMPVGGPEIFVQPEPPPLELALRAFGPRRLMWGSDYPPVSAREGYGNALRLPMERFKAMPGVSEEDLAAIFGGTALATFPVQG